MKPYELLGTSAPAILDMGTYLLYQDIAPTETDTSFMAEYAGLLADTNKMAKVSTSVLTRIVRFGMSLNFFSERAVKSSNDILYTWNYLNLQENRVAYKKGHIRGCGLFQHDTKMDYPVAGTSAVKAWHPSIN